MTETEELRRQSLATTTYVNVQCTYTDTATETQQLHVPVVIVSILNARANIDTYVGNKCQDAHPKHEAKEKGGGSSGRENHYGMGPQNQRCCNIDV